MLAVKLCFRHCSVVDNCHHTEVFPAEFADVWINQLSPLSCLSAVVLAFGNEQKLEYRH
jgi:hypothetical protein